MSKIAVIGSSEFIVGFQLSGIKTAIETKIDIMSQIKNLIRNKDIGIVIIEEKALQSLDEIDRNQVEDSISPVFIPLSEEGSQQSLRRLIMKSIGIDLLAEKNAK